MSLAALHGCTAAKHRFKDRRHGKKIYNSITLESETCGAAEQALTEFSGVLISLGLVLINWPGLSFTVEITKALVLTLWMRYAMKIDMTGLFVLRFAILQREGS